MSSGGGPALRPIGRRATRQRVLLASLLGGLLLSFPGVSAAESRGFVVSWFSTSVYSEEGDCPEGLYPNVEQNFRRILAEQGYDRTEVERLVKSQGAYIKYMPNRGRIGGKPANVYLNPTAVADPGARMMRGAKSFGFNLDGRTSSLDFTDPETGETGIDNRLFRALGCFTPERAMPPDRPSRFAQRWDLVRDSMPAWLIEVSGVESWRDDAEVRIEVLQAEEPITRNNIDSNPERDMTFRVTANPRYRNVARGRIVDGVLTSEPFDLNLVFDPSDVPEFHFRQARLRLIFQSDGSVHGILGAYHDWKELYWGLAASGVFAESVVSLDMPAAYYLLRRLADGDLDPVTGENRSISVAYGIDAVPAFIDRAPLSLSTSE